MDINQELDKLREIETTLKRPLIAGMPKYVYRRVESDLAFVRFQIRKLKELLPTE